MLPIREPFLLIKAIFAVKEISRPEKPFFNLL
jgi:hypothetical protein